MSAALLARPERYNDDQDSFAQEVHRFLTSRQPLARVRELADDATGRDAELWRRSATELGILGLMVPEEYGGAGFGFAEVSLVLTASGRALTSWPYLSSAVLATQCLLTSGDADAMERWLPGMVSGETVATVAPAGDAGSWALEHASVHAAPGPDGWSLNGTTSFVTDGQLADLILLFAADGRQTRLFAVRSDAPGVERASLPVLDATRKLSRFTFRDAPAHPVGAAEVTQQVHSSLLALAAAALACEASGGAAATLEITTRYAKDRRQFGRTIGSFQSIKHRCSEMYMRSEAASAFAESAALAVDAASREGSFAGPASQVDLATAAVYCCDAFLKSTYDMIQIHGGIGFTWEHDAHLFLRRAASSAKLFGGKTHHLAVLTRAIRDGSLLAREGTPNSVQQGEK